jgi:hypothetical protein
MTGFGRSNHYTCYVGRIGALLASCNMAMPRDGLTNMAGPGDGTAEPGSLGGERGRYRLANAPGPARLVVARVCGGGSCSLRLASPRPRRSVERRNAPHLLPVSAPALIGTLQSAARIGFRNQILRQIKSLRYIRQPKSATIMNKMG